MHGRGHEVGCLTGAAKEGLESSYYRKYGTESWKNFPVPEIDAYRAQCSGPGTTSGIYCALGTSSSPIAHFPT